MKHRRLTLLALATVMATTASAQMEWMRVEHAPGLEAGTSTALLPINNNKAYSYTQSIYDKACFNFDEGADIDTIWFYCVSPAATPAEDQNVNVYLAETDQSVGSSVKNWIAGTEVFSSTTTVQPTEAGWFPIALATPYHYSGTQNLVVVIDRKGSGGVGQTYSAVSGKPTRTSMGYSNDAAWAITKNGTLGTSWQADIRLSVRAPRTGRPVEGLTVTDADVHSASFEWEVSPLSATPTGFRVEYGKRGFSVGTGTVVLTPTAATSYTLTGLDSATRYDVYVSTVCGPDDTSAARKATFATSCAKIHIGQYTPWTYTYEEGQIPLTMIYGDNEQPLCWDFPGKSTTSTGYPRILFTEYGQLSMTANAGHPAVAVLPQFDLGMDEMMLTLNTGSSNLEYGYVTDPTDSNTFVSLGKCNGSTVADLSLLGLEIPSEARVALKGEATLTQITVAMAPVCKMPYGLSIDASTVGQRGFKATWSGDEGAQYSVVLTKSGDVEAGRWVTGNREMTFSGLDRGTYYKVSVRRICAAGDTTSAATAQAQTLGFLHTAVLDDASWGTIVGDTLGNGYVGLMRAVANENYHFKQWIYNIGASTYYSNIDTIGKYGDFTQPDGQMRYVRFASEGQIRVLSAQFAPDTFDVAVSAYEDWGYVSATGMSARMAYGSSFEATAVANPGYVFIGWSDGETAATRTVEVRGQVGLTAYFEPATAETFVTIEFSDTTVIDHVDTYDHSNSTFNTFISLTDAAHYGLTTAAEGAVLEVATVGGVQGYYLRYSADVSGSRVIYINVVPATYPLTLAANVAGYGTVTLNGVEATWGHTQQVPYGSKVTLMTQPAMHRHFERWSNGTDVDTTAMLYTFTMGEATTMTATFSSDTVTVAYVAPHNPDAIMVYEGHPVYASAATTFRMAYGTNYTFSAGTTERRYTLVRFMAGSQVVEGGTINTDAVQDITWKALYSVEQVTVTAQADVEGVTIEPREQTVDYNTAATITAYDGEHQVFSHWTDAAGSTVSTEKTMSAVVTQNTQFTAHYIPKQYELTVATAEHCTAYTIGGAAAQSAMLDYGSTVVLSATAEAGYRIDSWTSSNDDTISGATATVTVGGPIEYTPHAVLADHTVNIVAGVGGALVYGTDTVNLVSLNGQHIGDMLTVEALPLSIDYSFSRWSDNITDNPRTFVVNNSNINIEAVFTIGDSLQCNAVVDPAEAGTVSGSRRTDKYMSTEMVTFTVTPAEGWHIDHWTDGVLGGLVYSVRAEEKTHTAYMVRDSVALMATVNDGVMGSVSGAGRYLYGDVTTLVATPNAGYAIVGWVDNGDTTWTTSNNHNHTMGASNEVTALFGPQSYWLSIAAENATVTVDGADYSTPVMVEYGSTVHIEVTPDEHYDFSNWSDNYSAAVRDYAMSNAFNTTLTAYATAHMYDVTAQSADQTMGYAIGTTKAAVGATVPLTAIALPHHHLTGWDNGESTEATNVVVAGDTTVTARFAVDEHSLRVALAAGSEGRGEVDTLVNGDYAYGTAVTVEAVAETGYRFAQWNDGNTNARREVRVEGDMTLEAAFEYIDYTVSITSNNVAMGTVGVSPAGPYHHGDEVTATAAVTDADQYKFIGWSDGESALVRTVTVEGDVSLTAIFADADSWSVFVQSNNQAWGGATASEASVLNNATVTLTATAAEHYAFVQWSDGNAENPRSLVVTENVNLTAEFEPLNYTVTIGVEGEGGTVSGSATGSYAYGSTISFEAVADQAGHYHFAQWSDSNSSAVRAEQVLGDTTYMARFEKDSYAVTVSVDNGGTYTLTPDQAAYEYGSELRIDAEAAENYHITGWTKNGADYAPTLGAGATEMYVNEAAAYRVLTAKDQYQLTATSANPNMGRVEGATNGWYDFDQTVQVVAVAAENHEFIGWDGDTLSGDTLTLVMNQEQNHTAAFRLKSYAVTAQAGEHGAISYKIGTGGEVSGNLSAALEHGTQVQLTAEATEAGYEFAGWSDGVQAAQRTVVVSGEVSIEATFRQAEYTLTLTVNNTTMGTVEITAGEDSAYHYGDEVTIRATVSDDDQYKFLSWNDGETAAERTVTMTGNAEYKALFGWSDMYLVSAQSNNSAQGTVVADAQNVFANTTVHLTATAAEHYHIVGWSDIEGYNTDSERDIVVTGDTIITAMFAIDTHAVDLLTDMQGNATGYGVYAYGSLATLVASPVANHHFNYWEDTDGNRYTDNPMTITVDGNKSYQAVFGIDTVRIQAEALHGTVSVADTTVDYGDSFTLTATADEHYSHFKGWKRNGVVVDGEESISVDATADGFYYAVFDIDTVNLSVTVNDQTMGSVNGLPSGKYTYGTEVELTAVAANHYHFEGWTGDTASTEETLQMTLESDMAVEAQFAINQHHITVAVAAESEGMGEATAIDADYAYGESVDVEAVAYDGMSFTGWSDGNMAASRTLTMGESDIEIEATFDSTEYTVTVTVNDPTMGEVLGQLPVYKWHYEVELTAHCKDTNLYKFIGWSDGQHGRDTVRTEVIEGNLNLTAIFTDKEKLSVFVQSNNMAWGTATASENAVNVNHEVTLTATPAEHYHFEYWTNGTDTVSTEAEYTMTVTGNVNMVAMFAIDMHHVAYANSYDNIVAESDVAYGTVMTFAASEPEGFHFKRFENTYGVTMSEDEPMELEVVQDTTVVAVYDIDTVTVTIEAENGTVQTDTLRYLWGEEATFEAVADEHYHFVGWSNGEIDTTRTVVLHGDTTVSVSFEKDTMLVTLQNNMEGEVFSGYFEWGTPLTIEADEYEHYHFKGFYDEEGEMMSESATMDITIGYEDLTVTAMYAIDTHVVTLVAENGTIETDTLRYTYGSEATFEAVADENYQFGGWKVNGVAAGNDNPMTVTVEGDMTVEAVFGIDLYTLSVSSSNMAMGYVSGTQNGNYDNGTAIELEAVANEHYVFVGWMSGDDTIGTENTMSFNISQDTTIVAVFDYEYFSIELASNDTAMGTVSGAGQYTYHQLVNIAAEAAEGHHFVMWSDSVATARRMVYVEENVSLTAMFAIDTHYVTVTVNDTTMGSATGEGWYNWGDTVTVIATTNANFNFVGFNGATDHVDSISFVVTADTTIMAIFDYQYLTLYSTFEHGSVEIEVNGVQANTSLMPVVAHYGDSIAMRATADEHYRFAGWVEYSRRIDTTYRVDTTYETVDSIFTNPMTGNTDTITDTLSVTIDTVMVLNTVYDTAAIYEEAEIGFRIHTNRYINAMFEPIEVALTLVGMHVSLEGAGVYYAGDTVTVSATAMEHYVFKGWSDGLDEQDEYNIISTEASYSFVIEEDLTLWAITEGEELTVTLEAAPAEGGTVEGAGVYHYGDEVTITATANEGYSFLYWMRADNVSISEATYTFTIVENVSLRAVFHNEGIEGVDESSATVYASGDVIYINGAEAQRVRVYDAVGRMVSSTVAEGESVQVRVDASGVYMVQVGNSRAQRVMVVR